MHPIRRRMLELLAEPDSAVGLSRKLGLPRQKVNYHLRELEREGFVRLVEQRRRRNLMERIVVATARSWVIDPAVLGALGADPAQVRDRFSSAYLVALAAQLIRDVATLRRRAAEVDQRLATLSLSADVRFRSADERNAFAEELSQSFAQLVAKYHDADAPGGRPYRFVIGAHPVITKSETQARAEAQAHRQSEEHEDE